MIFLTSECYNQMEGVTNASESHTLPLPPRRRRPQARCPTILPSMAPFTSGLVFTPVGGIVRSRRREWGLLGLLYLFLVHYLCLSLL